MTMESNFTDVTISGMDRNDTQWDRSRSVWETTLLALALAAIMTASIIGNIVVIIAVRSTKSLRDDYQNLLIVNLSVTDLANAVLVIFPSLMSVITDSWFLGTFFCKFCCAANYCLIIVSMLTLAFISIDRFQSITNPLKYYTSTCTKTKLICMILYAWLQGIAFAFPPALLGWVVYDTWEAICAIDWFMDSTAALHYVIAANVICFIIPGLIILVCYSTIGIYASRNKDTYAIPSNSQQSHAQKEKREKVNRRVIRSLVAIVIIFFICMTPFCITKLMKVIHPENRGGFPGEANTFASVMQYLASATNPFIYGIFRKNFRRAFKRQYRALIRRIFPCVKSNDDFIDTSRSYDQSRSINTSSRSPTHLQVKQYPNKEGKINSVISSDATNLQHLRSPYHDNYLCSDDDNMTMAPTVTTSCLQSKQDDSSPNSTRDTIGSDSELDTVDRHNKMRRDTKIVYV